ncbi:hypothetical protein QVD17_01131 [Tagetes erecta]|uniref:Uncharacterized protein n=1 Tax=Tagetes erecta TaxID=13708 RepID=A0AAD8L5V4_TARER|nr:hypothetical protein QVD17_01128 [Tagetes erecta]KAK1435370.1 hypothetical protein QVD17_01131 [Tagetes erecta]
MHISRLCSCYAPSTGNPQEKSSNRSNKKHHHQHVIIKKDEQVRQGKIDGVSRENRIKTYGADHRGIPIKSNFKKTLVQEDVNPISSGIRKVTWPDAHGKSIAHVQEFEPSVSDDG